MLARWRAATDYPAGPNNAFAYCRFFRVGCRVRLTTSHGGTAAAGHRGAYESHEKADAGPVGPSRRRVAQLVDVTGNSSSRKESRTWTDQASCSSSFR